MLLSCLYLAEGRHICLRDLIQMRNIGTIMELLLFFLDELKKEIKKVALLTRTIPNRGRFYG